jgi:hypothetical protein
LPTGERIRQSKHKVERRSASRESSQPAKSCSRTCPPARGFGNPSIKQNEGRLSLEPKPARHCPPHGGRSGSGLQLSGAGRVFRVGGVSALRKPSAESIWDPFCPGGPIEVRGVLMPRTGGMGPLCPTYMTVRRVSAPHSPRMGCPLGLPLCLGIGCVYGCYTSCNTCSLEPKPMRRCSLSRGRSRGAGSRGPGSFMVRGVPSVLRKLRLKAQGIPLSGRALLRYILGALVAPNRAAWGLCAQLT